jgi:hypothetical protein
MSTQRYTFWRTPEGRPYKKDREKHAPRHILAEIGIRSEDKKNGGFHWIGFDPMQMESAIQSMVAIYDQNNKELNNDDVRSIVYRAVNSAISKQGGGKPITPRAFLNEADRLAAQLFGQPSSQYTLITALSIKSLPAKSIKLLDCEIIPANRNDYPIPPSCSSVDVEEFLPRGYVCIGVKTEGRSVHEAADNAFGMLDVIRGIWNLFATYGRWTLNLSSPIQRRLGVIHKGRFHTLYDDKRQPAVDNYWYDFEYAKAEPFEPRNGWSQIEKERIRAFTHLRKLPYKDDLANIFRRYAVALDHSDHNAALLLLWGILEKITATIGGPYDKTIRRIAWYFGDRRLAKDQINSLRLLRNRYVHAAHSVPDDQGAQMAKWYVDHYLLRLLRNDFRVTTLQEFGEQLGLPRSLAKLKKRRRGLNVAIGYAERWEKNQKTKPTVVQANKIQLP